MDWTYSVVPKGTITHDLLCSGCGWAGMTAHGGHHDCDGLPVCYECGHEIGCGWSSCQHQECRIGVICHPNCKSRGHKGPLPPLGYMIFLNKTSPGHQWEARKGPLKPGWKYGDPYGTLAPANAGTQQTAPTSPGSVLTITSLLPAPPPPSPYYTPKEDESYDGAILNPEEVAHKRIVLTDRIKAAICSATMLGHAVDRITVMDVRSQQPMKFPCDRCGFELIVEQRTLPQGGKDAVHGPASALPCKPRKQ